MTKHVEPSVTEKAFNCPHCGVLTTQTWHNIYTDEMKNSLKAPVPPYKEVPLLGLCPLYVSPETRGDFENLFGNIRKGQPFHFARYLEGKELHNIFISECYHCHKFAVWVYDKLVYPNHKCQIQPNQDMNPDIIQDFNEARELVDISPRSAAALLRLCVQKLCAQLGEKGKKIDDDIASLVRKGLDVKIQKALDVVRVIGNDAVHPGEMNLNDTPDVAHKLFHLVNFIANQMITQPITINELYEYLPEGKLEAIEKRDTPKEPL